MNDEAQQPSRLGRGLGAMFNEVSGIKAGSAPTGGGYLRIPLADLHLPGTARAPDEHLTASVRSYGVLQPVLVARAESGYRLLAGARRVQAAREAGLADVPALIIPPDRAGELDVFLEENLTRADLTEFDRIRLRDQWMRETGRDAEAAGRRIPDLPAPPAPVALETTDTDTISPYWKLATVLLAPLCVILLAATLMAYGPKFATTAAAPSANRPATDTPAVTGTGWMDTFRFPGQERIVRGNRLILAFTAPCFADGAITPTGIRLLNQLAAVASASEQKVAVRLLVHGGDPELNRVHADLAVRHLAGEGLPGVLALPMAPDAKLGNQSVILVEITPAP
jgi:hypothetical protein